MVYKSTWMIVKKNQSKNQLKLQYKKVKRVWLLGMSSLPLNQNLKQCRWVSSESLQRERGSIYLGTLVKLGGHQTDGKDWRWILFLVGGRREIKNAFAQRDSRYMGAR